MGGAVAAAWAGGGMIYLDHQATTPLAPEALAAMLPYLEGRFGNPHSAHRFGYAADAGVAAARAQLASLLNTTPETIVFTSGATEAANLALKGAMQASGRRRLVTVATEHSCVLESARWLERIGVALTVLPVGAEGLLDPAVLAAAMDDDVALVAVMAVNNEIGVVQPVTEFAAVARRHGALMFCDAAQAAGKIPLDPAQLGIDMMALSAHKFCGPKGVGALWMRPGTHLAPQQHGGGQEGPGLRSGTLSPALCAGFGAAASVAAERMARDAVHVRRLWDVALAVIDVPHRLNGSQTARWHGNLSLTFPGIDGARLLADLRSVAVSSGAACAEAQGRPSHVLAALGLSATDARATLRIGWGRTTTEDEVTRGIGMICEAVRIQQLTAA
jgi:cysteine desulfurase